MAAKKLSQKQLQKVVDAVQKYGSVGAAATATRIPKSTLECQYKRALQEQVVRSAPAEPKAFDVEPIPDELPTAEELLDRRSKQFSRKRDAKDARHLVPVSVNIEGPIGLAVVGDPHVDDDGTDIDLLRSHIAILNAHEALLPLGIGDYSNNWVGRLARLYGQRGYLSNGWCARCIGWRWWLAITTCGAVTAIRSSGWRRRHGCNTSPAAYASG
jgi:hypothetical protein